MNDPPMSDVGRVPVRWFERGAILPMMAIMLIVLMGAAAMAVDLGWLFWNSIEIQHGADAAALSGVVYEPDQRAEAHTEGIGGAAENGYVDASLGGPDTVQIIDFVDDPSLVEHDNQLRATVTHSVPTFFLKVFGIDSVDIQRTAVAQYTLPLFLGSPEAFLGADPSRGLAPGFWVSIHGTWAKKNHGDRYGDGCLGEAIGLGCPQNPEHRPSLSPGQANASGGYVYGIEVPAGAGNLALQIFDGPWYDCAFSSSTCGKSLTGDEESSGTTWFMLYGPDPTPLDTTDGNELLCVIKYDPRSPGRSVDVAGWDDSWDDWEDVSPQSLIAQLWDDMATSADRQPGCAGNFDRGPGIYPLRVMLEHDDGQNSYNKFSLRVTTTGPAPSIFGLGDMSVYANADSGSATRIFLAEVEALHAGKDLIIELFDVGDITGGSGGDRLEFYDGSGAVAQCSWESDGGDSESLGPCVISAPNKRFNGQVLTITIPIASDYTCTGLACWYRFKYVYTGDVNDTTTWTAFVVGNPIRIIE